MKEIHEKMSSRRVAVFLSEVLPLIYFVSIAGALQNDTNFNLLQFLEGMHSVWGPVTLLFLLIAERFIGKTSHSSGLCSWGFKWRSVLRLCTCTASSYGTLLQTCWWFYSGLFCTQTLPMHVGARFSCLCASLPSSLHSSICCPLMLSPDTAVDPSEGT